MVVAIKDRDRVAERLSTWSKQYGLISKPQEAGSLSDELDAGLDWVYQVDSCLLESRLPARKLVIVAEALIGLHLVTTSNGSRPLVDAREVLGLYPVITDYGGHDIGVAQLITKGKDSFGTNCAIGGPEVASDAGLVQGHHTGDADAPGAHELDDGMLGVGARDASTAPRTGGGAGPSLRPSDFETDLTGILAAGSRRQIHQKGWKFKEDPSSLRGIENFYRARQVMQRTSQRRLESDNPTSTIIESARQEEKERDVMFEKILYEIREIQGGHSRTLDNVLEGQERIFQLLVQLVLDRDAMPDADYRQMVSEVKTLVGRSNASRQ
jgi:hypothetical protein